MEQKPLVIKVEESVVPNGQIGQWADLSGNIQKFTSEIKTEAINDGSDISAQVSGIPTAYARANLFMEALRAYGRSKDDNASHNLNTFYEQLSDEWRGFIACIALDYSRMAVERVYLAYSDGRSVIDTANIYETKGSFGNMLFHRRPLWCECPQDCDVEHRDVPFIDILKYDGKVVGATSPESLLFTACSYAVDKTEGRPWVDYRTHRFKNPLTDGALDKNRTLQLFAYVNYLIEGIDGGRTTGINGLAAYYSYLGERGISVAYDNVLTNLVEWRTQIQDYARSKGYKTEEASVPPIDLFRMPFALAFNFKDELYGLDGVLYNTADGDGVKFNPKDLLAPNTARVARVIVRKADKQRLSDLPVHLLAADVKGMPGSKAYFALPLSVLGLSVFGKNIGALVGDLEQSSRIPSRVTAVFDPVAETNNLEVTLHLSINSSNGEVTKEMRETYSCGGIIDGSELIVWPNFISRKWHRYFMYSELPHNVNLNGYPFQAVPFVGDELDGFRTVTRGDGTPAYLAENGHDVDYDYTSSDGKKRHVECSLHIVSGSAVTDNPYKYEIYESNHPFKGVRLSLPSGQESGFLIIKYGSARDSALPYNGLDIQDNSLRQTSLGVDFGSTNTSIAYYNPDTNQPEGLRFSNRRVPLLHVGADSDDDVANECQLLFFQSNGILSNSIKSTLTMHDSRRVRQERNETKELAKFEKEVKGGFPCFSRNLPVFSASRKDRFIKLKTSRIGEIVQVQNMKWDADERNIAYKKAYLRSLLLHVYAELFCKGLYPSRLKWSYPSSMRDSLLAKYNSIWSTLTAVNPLTDAFSASTSGMDDSMQLSVSQFAYKSGNMASASASAGKQATGGGLFGGGGNMFGGGSGLFGGGNNMFAAGQGSFGAGQGSFGGSSAESAQASSAAGQHQQSFDMSGNAFLAGGNGGGIGQQMGADDSSEVLEKDDDTKPVTFNPVNLLAGSSFESMTEASAVANFLSVNADDREALTVCFDIGGSTTDISAMCPLAVGEGSGLTMIKQNSIHFAAQLVSEATSDCANFQNVLLSTCQEYGLQIEGLNLGDSRYSPDNAPYYFEQMVDRLDASQLPFFYQKIGADCSKLMCVNLYVTGLIMYYAGLLVRKLIKQVRNSKECRWSEANGKRPKVSVNFAGKGARIMEWLGFATSHELSGQFYQAMFCKGLGVADGNGQLDVANYISNLEINFPKNNNDVKFEVSKGLAKPASNIMRPSNSKPIEVIGEEGFSIEDKNGNTVPLAADNSITPFMMKCLGDKFYGGSAAGPRFRDFLSLFYQVAQQYFGYDKRPEDIMQALDGMQVLRFIKNTPDYVQAASSDGKFDYVAPVLILEGLEFYEDFLLK